jgi:tRNA U34 5-methylaminomethyl-2-thiouridine-forming methyltransferase MnmC
LSFVVFDPRGGRIAAAPSLAARPKALAGLKLGVLDNTKEQADILLGRAAHLLAQDGAKPTFAQKPSFSRVAPPEVIEQLAMCDIVITGLGG